jgi:hypothetical protein
MDVFGIAARMVEALESAGVPYMVVGALSVSVFGIPRATKDVDIVVSLETRQPLNEVERRLQDIADFDPQITFETITGSLRHLVYSKTNPPITVELFELGADPFMQSRFARRRQEPYLAAHAGGCGRPKTSLGASQRPGGCRQRNLCPIPLRPRHGLHRALVRTARHPGAPARRYRLHPGGIALS